MNAIALRALQRSIERWWWKTEKLVTKLDITTHDCPLCAVYYNDGCIGCPVNQEGKHYRCDNTPYYEVAFLVSSYVETPLPEDEDDYYTPYYNILKVAVQRELAHLVSLLPPEAQTKYHADESAYVQAIRQDTQSS